MTRSESRQVLQVDPRAPNELCIDLHGDCARAVAVKLNGAEPKGDAVLPLVALDAAGKPTVGGATFHLHDGRSRDSVPLVPGRYLYILQSDSEHGAIYGVVCVPESADASPLNLAWSGQQVPRATLANGIEIQELEDLSTEGWTPGLRQIRWPKSAGAGWDDVWVPSRCKYGLLE